MQTISDQRMHARDGMNAFVVLTAVHGPSESFIDWLISYAYNFSLHRFIPNREGQDLGASFNLLHDDASPATPSKTRRRPAHGELHFQKSKQP